MKNGVSQCYNKLRVAAYCRVSTDKDDQTNSLASQRRYLQITSTATKIGC